MKNSGIEIDFANLNKFYFCEVYKISFFTASYKAFKVFLTNHREWNKLIHVSNDLLARYLEIGL